MHFSKPSPFLGGFLLLFWGFLGEGGWHFIFSTFEIVGKSKSWVVPLVTGIVLVLHQEKNDTMNLYFKRKVSFGYTEIYFSACFDMSLEF